MSSLEAWNEAEASLKQRLALTLFYGPLQVEDPDLPWNSLTEAQKDSYYRVADALKPHIIEWASLLMGEAVAAAFAEGVSAGIDLANQEIL